MKTNLTVKNCLLFLLLIPAIVLSQEKNPSPENQLEGIVKNFNRQTPQKNNNLNGIGYPQPDAMNKRFLNGQTAGELFGYSVSNAGDVNSDGFSDIIVGAERNNNDAGRAYIYFGGPTNDYTPGVVLTGEAAGNNFGCSVSAAGDVNGDGFSDVIVGAYMNDEAGSNSGKAYIYFGGASMDNTPDIEMTGEAEEDFFGCSVSTAGDVNGDGFYDVIVGAYGNDEAGNSSGKTYVYFGGGSMDNTPDVEMTGEGEGNEFGYSVSEANDVNGDGYSDVIIGAYKNDAGRAYIYYGGPAMDHIADVILTGETTGEQFGYSVSTGGDVNEDGYADLIVGANHNGEGGVNAGKAYIYLGGPSMDNSPDIEMTGEMPGDYLGVSVSYAGDVNGDGYSDVVAGAYGNDAMGNLAGRAYVFFGGAAMDNTVDVVMTGEAEADYFGCSVSSAGDTNGDGYSEVIAGACRNDLGGINAGRAYIYSISLFGPDIPDLFFTGSDDDYLGSSVSSAGDVNGDGFSDIIVRASKTNSTINIYLGGPQMDYAADITLIGEAAEDNFGISISSAGDVNGDGFSDVIAGAPGNGVHGKGTGRAYIFYGGQQMNSKADVILSGQTAGDYFGSSVSSAGDINGDGYSDVIVGSPANGTYAEGSAYIFYGGSSMNSIPDVIISSKLLYENLGYSVSTAGDVNGDGYSDIIVGTHINAGGAAGSAYVYYGGASTDNKADVVLTGEAGYKYGSSVSSAGDMNGDGYSDVIVGAATYSGTGGGRAYIYYGGASMNNFVDGLFTGESSGDYFGNSVSAAGDVNGDGYSDVIVGANQANANGRYSGSAFIYFGGPVIDNKADIEMTGEAALDYFGKSVAAAGDVNKDGFSDVIVGAPGNDAGGDGAGKAYIYLSSSPPVKQHIMSVKDVPSDQGKHVLVSFIRSGYDVGGQNRISEYLVQISEPPGQSGFTWNYVASVKATHSNEYSCVVTTPADSFSNPSNTYYFRIVAYAVNPNETWYSNIISGHSVDNLAPIAPANFQVRLNSSMVHLGWKANQETDLRDYYIYRGNSPRTENLIFINSTTDTVFTDTASTFSNKYYFVQAYDIHNNGSPFSVDSITSILSVNTTSKTPDKFKLFRNYPNPFNPVTTIKFALPEQAEIKINVYNILGQLVKTIAQGVYQAGNYNINFDPVNLPSGIYIYRLESDEFTDTKKMIYLR